MDKNARNHRLQIRSVSLLLLIRVVILMTVAFLVVLISLNPGGTTDKTLEQPGCVRSVDRA